MSSKFVKNNKVSTDTWAGKQLDASETYEIPHGNFELWQKLAHDSGGKVETDVNSGDLQVSKDGISWLSAGDGLAYLKFDASGIIRDNLVMPNPNDKQILAYNSTNEKWECTDIHDLVVIPAKINFYHPGSSGGKWAFAPYGDTLGQSSNVIPYVVPFDFQVTSILFTNKKGDADAIIRVHKNMDLVTHSHEWTLPINSIWAVKNSGLETWTFSQFDKLSVYIAAGANNADDVYIEFNGYYYNKNTTDSSGSTY